MKVQVPTQNSKQSRLERFFELYWKNLFQIYLLTGVGVVLVVFSYVVITLQALWFPPADILLPAKVVLLVGIGIWIVGTLRNLNRAIKQSDWTGMFFSIVSAVLLTASLAGYFNNIIAFLTENVPLTLSENVLPFNLRILASAALILPLIYIIVSLILFFIVLAAKSFVELLFKPRNLEQKETKK